MSPVEVSISPLLLRTGWATSCLPLPSCLMVCFEICWNWSLCLSLSTPGLAPTKLQEPERFWLASASLLYQEVTVISRRRGPWLLVCSSRHFQFPLEDSWVVTITGASHILATGPTSCFHNGEFAQGPEVTGVKDIWPVLRVCCHLDSDLNKLHKNGWRDRWNNFHREITHNSSVYYVAENVCMSAKRDPHFFVPD